ncbi:MFS transporter [Novosphingobium soli]|jgi:MFS family permease|uniref:MFS transporter n=1 Tax=Novosphingobium soli TaxID=574956 RepID=A0ABV6CRC3_9SPHN
MLLLAAAAAAAGQTAILAFLPTLVDSGAAGLAPRTHDFHVASLTTVHPFAALLLAPFWGRLADRMDYRIILRTALIVLALATAPIGAVSLPALYLLRALAGMASAAIIPLALLSASSAVPERGEQAKRFTWLTAFVFLGDMAGPLLAEGSAALTPRTPLLMVGLGIAVVAILLGLAHLPPRCVACPEIRHPRASSRPATSPLLLIALVGGGGLAAIHVALLVTRAGDAPSRETIAWMLSLCGFAMLAAQLFLARVAWLVTMPRRLAGLTLALLAASLFLFPLGHAALPLAGIIFVAGWSSASLRLVTSFWIGGNTVPSGAGLGLQHAAASVGQALAPLALAFTSPRGQPVILWSIGSFALLLLLVLPLAWRGAKAG